MLRDYQQIKKSHIIDEPSLKSLQEKGHKALDVKREA